MPVPDPLLLPSPTTHNTQQTTSSRLCASARQKNPPRKLRGLNNNLSYIKQQLILSQS